MAQTDRPGHARRSLWMLVLVLLVGLRLPSLVQPAGGDQLLYSYTGQRVLAGDVPYRDAWDQKPPAILFLYAAMWAVWPHESVVAAADLLAAVTGAWLLIGLGRRLFGGRAGELAAAIFLLLGDPGIQRLAGLHVRAQCETFIAVAVTAALLCAWRDDSRRSRPGRLFIAGVCCGVAFWLKYNAIVYAAPVLLAACVGGTARPSWRTGLARAGWLAAGAAAVSVAMLAYFGAAGAIGDLWLATIGYNVQYSGETYTGPLHALQYVVTFPVRHARVDGLWFLGGFGALGLALTLLIRTDGPRAAAWLSLAWLGAVVISMAINGSRGLPQYFLQAAPALALAASGGLLQFWRHRGDVGVWRAALPFAAVAIVAGLWRVGVEPSPVWQPRLFGLPQAAANLAFDLRYASGGMTRHEYLTGFGRAEAGKFSPQSVERLADHVRATTPAGDPIYVFGFASGGAYVKSGRASASRFFWSRPVVLEFERGRPGYGSDAVLADLQRARPAIVALQRQDWGLAEPHVQNSQAFFMNTPGLRGFLEAGYVPDYEDASFVVWRRKS